MLRFLSPGWIAALHDAAAADATLRSLTDDLTLIVEQEILGGPDGDIRYHVTLDHGDVAVRSGPAASPTVRFSQDYETAAAISLGNGSAQRAFMTGRLRVGGDLRVLLTHSEALAQLQDVFAPVRERTTAPAIGSQG